MSSDLDKRLRELDDIRRGLRVRDGVGSAASAMEFLHLAAKIGAEIEREACALEATKRRSDLDDTEYSEAARHIERAIRARGNK